MCDTEAGVCSCVYEFIGAGFCPQMLEPPHQSSAPSISPGG